MSDSQSNHLMAPTHQSFLEKLSRRGEMNLYLRRRRPLTFSLFNITFAADGRIGKNASNISVPEMDAPPPFFRIQRVAPAASLMGKKGVVSDRPNQFPGFNWEVWLANKK